MTTDSANSDQNWLKPTLKMLTAAYPEGISNEDYLPLLSLLYNEGEMSIRNLSQALGEYYQRPYVDFLPDVDSVVVDSVTAASDRDRVRNRLALHGYEQWLREE